MMTLALIKEPAPWFLTLYYCLPLVLPAPHHLRFLVLHWVVQSISQGGEPIKPLNPSHRPSGQSRGLVRGAAEAKEGVWWNANK